mgnify:FL=1
MLDIELLSPAKNVHIGRQAILHGADAVYIGASSHGARVAAANSVNEIRELTAFAHLYGARIYVTVNTLVYDEELRDVERLIHQLYKADVDALIVQDMGLLRLDLPPIALHASTQCDIRTPQKARFLADMGFTQLVLPREMSLQEMAEIRKAVPDNVALEAFVHGALCVSYSGDCQASQITVGRSANRGACAQICRLPYDLYDGTGRKVVAERHLLSLKDLNRLSYLTEMLQAGITSFKIEGRLKDEAYVKNVTAAYRQALDKIIAANPELYRASSLGHVSAGFVPDLSKCFNRGYTSYFTKPNPSASLASIKTPKHIGEPVGTVTDSNPKFITANLQTALSNGDGLGYFDDKDTFVGFRLNRVEGKHLFPATPVFPPKGTTIYRNSDKLWADTMSRAAARRAINASLTLRSPRPDFVIIDATDASGLTISVSASMPMSEARSEQTDVRRRILSKSGDTPFDVVEINDRIASDIFVPASALTELRRQALTTLETARSLAWRRPPCGKENKESVFPYSKTTYHDNIANALARGFYADHGVEVIAPALEVSPVPSEKTRVMTTRYCIRRELGACLKKDGNKKLPEPLTIKAPGISFALEFDCQRCQMCVWNIPKK